jgi:hypothetical protein
MPFDFFIAGKGRSFESLRQAGHVKGTGSKTDEEAIDH